MSQTDHLWTERVPVLALPVIEVSAILNDSEADFTDNKELAALVLANQKQLMANQMQMQKNVDEFTAKLEEFTVNQMQMQKKTR